MKEGNEKRKLVIFTARGNENSFSKYIAEKSNMFQVEMIYPAHENAFAVAEIEDELLRIREGCIGMSIFIIFGGTQMVIPSKIEKNLDGGTFLSDAAYAISYPYFIGRFPTDNLAELQALCETYLAVAGTKVPPGICLLSATNDDTEACNEADRMIKKYNITPEHFPLTCRNDYMNGLRAIADASFLCFLGHGNVDFWGLQSDIIECPDIPPLPNGQHRHVISLACLTGANEVGSLACQAILQQKALTFWGASALSYQRANNVIFLKLWEIYLHSPELYLGELYFNTLLSVGMAGVKNMRWAYTLYGDPTICLK